MPTQYTNRIHCPKCQLKTAVSACTDDKWEEIKNSREKAFQTRKTNAKDDTKKTRRTKHANWWKAWLAYFAHNFTISSGWKRKRAALDERPWLPAP